MFTNSVKKLMVAIVISLCISSASATTIDLSYDVAEFSSVDGIKALEGFKDAANFWSGLLKDDVTINLGIGFSALGTDIIGSTQSFSGVYNYRDVVAAMAADATSVFDVSAVNSLPCEN